MQSYNPFSWFTSDKTNIAHSWDFEKTAKSSEKQKKIDIVKKLHKRHDVL